MNLALASPKRRLYFLVGASVLLGILLTAITAILINRTPSDEIKLIGCAGPSSPLARVQVTNRSDKQTVYFVTVRFSNGNSEKAIAVVDPGKTEIATAPAWGPTPATLTCQVGNVERRYGTVTG